MRKKQQTPIRMAGDKESSSHKRILDKHEAVPFTDTFFRQVIESLEDYAVFTTDTKGTITSWNRGAERLLGYSEEEIIGKKAKIFFTPEDIKKKEPEKELGNALKKGKAYDERFHVKKNGVRFWGSGLVFPLKDGKGVVIGFTKIMRNRSQLRLAEGRLSQLAAIVESSNDAIISRDLTGIILTWNKGAERLFGYTAAEVVGKHISLTIPPHLDHEVVQPDILAKRRGVPILFDTIRRRKDGSLVDVSVTVSPIKNVKGIVTGASIIARDITERKMLEKQKDDFIGIASHELKTPVTSIKAYTQLLHKRFIKTEDAHSAELVEKMDSQLDKLTGLIGDLLDVTKIAAGKLQFNLGYFDMNELVREVVEEMQRMTEQHTIVTKLQKSKTIHGDRERVGQVITNLISNAIKYSPKAHEIIVTTEYDAKNVTLCVRDFGVGISKEKQEKVFERFYRVSGPNDQTFPGLGLGLYIVSEIIKRQGGRIWVISEGSGEDMPAGRRGSTFCFTLPIGKKRNRRK